MNKALCIALAVAMLAASRARAGEEFNEIAFYTKLAEKQLAGTRAVPVGAERAGARASALAAIPRYFHSRSDDARFTFNGTDLKMSKSRANGAGVTLLYTRRVADWFSFGLLYEYAFLDVRGGMAVPAGEAARAREDVRWQSHTAGIQPEFALADFGRLRFSVAQSFDRADGHEELGALRRGVDGYGADVTSLAAWWEKDFQFGCTGWKLTPYAGWRSLYAAIRDRNNWRTGGREDDGLWAHLASAGAKASFQCGPLGMSFRGGVSHRTGGSDIPLFGAREVAPGVTHVSHGAHLDKTVGAVGANVTYLINDRALVGVGYDGMFGKDTGAHTGSLTFMLSF